ncbi:MAG: DUF58 domain-containing protein [Actinobacteria bacterium]|nr:DUF58 domain-containing protein [Actinomycetota bacterium]
MDRSEARRVLIGAGIVLGLGALAAANVPLLMWAVAVGLLGAAGLVWERLPWRGVEVSARFRPARVFVGEPVAVHVRIENAKRFPLPLVRLTVRLPAGLLPVGERGSFRGHYRRLSVGGRSEVRLELPIRVLYRGEYRLDGIEVEIADPFDLMPVRREILPEQDLLVFPEPRINVPVPVLRRLPFGSPAPAARMFEDRERFAGVRPYEPGDPLNRIHWKLTAHAGGLQTKLFEPTRSAHVLFALDLAAGEPFWDSIFPGISEDVIGWASSLARRAFGAGWRVGLVANTHYRRGRGLLWVPPSAARGHEAALFAALARMPGDPTADLAPVLRERGRHLAGDASVVVLSARPGPSLRQEIAALRRRGTEVVHASPLQASPAGADA